MIATNYIPTSNAFNAAASALSFAAFRTCRISEVKLAGVTPSNRFACPCTARIVSFSIKARHRK